MAPLTRSKTCSLDDKIVKELALLLRKKGDKILNEQTKLTFTLYTLISLNRSLRKLQTENSSDEIVLLSSELLSGVVVQHLESDLRILKDFLEKIFIIKVTRGNGTIQGSVDLSPFHSLCKLELKRVPIHLFVGLQMLRPCLKSISCVRCIDSLEDLFVSCGGDRSSAFSWSELVSVKLTNNGIRHIDNSLRLLPSLVSLDLSHNFITDTEGLEFLTELQFLNLNYNCLQRLPVLGSRARIRLKTLAVRNNEIESLEGLEAFLNLQQFDVAYNCLMDHCCLSVFLHLPLLRTIYLEGNPVACHDQHRMLTAQHLHERSLTVQCVIDGKNLTKTEVEAVRKQPSDCRTWKHRSVESYENHSMNHSINSVAEPPSTISSSVNACKDSNSEASCGMFSSGEFNDDNSKQQLVVIKKSRKNPIIREVLIADDSEVVKMGQKVVCETIRVDNSGVGSVSKDLVATKDEIENLKQQHGAEWLVVGSKLNLLTPGSDKNDFETFALPVDCCKTDIAAERRHRSSQASDDVIVLDSETEPPPLHYMSEVNDDSQLNADGLLWGKNTDEDGKSENEEDSDDDDAMLPPFIVQMEKPGADSSVTVLLVVTDRDLREKDALTGRTIERLDLRSICSVNSLLSPMDYSGTTCEGPQIKIMFSYVRKDRRERVYTMEDSSSRDQFLGFLKPLVDTKILDEMLLDSLQCLKCSAQFYKNDAIRVVRRTCRPRNDDNLLFTNGNSPKERLFEVNACPKCRSEMIVECQMSPNFSSTPLIGAMPVKQTKSGNYSSSLHNLPLSEEHRNSGNAFKSASCSNACASSSENSCQAARASSCNIVQVEVEVYPPSTNTRGCSEPRVLSSLPHIPTISSASALCRSGSDITILSNPSQSSIMVVPGGHVDNLLDVISERSTDSSKVAFVNQVIPDISVSKSELVDEPSLNRNLSQHLESVSSGSLTDSACTAVEKSTHESNLSPTPDSFLSALSGRDSNSTFQCNGSACGQCCTARADGFHDRSVDYQKCVQAVTEGDSCVSSDVQVLPLSFHSALSDCETVTWSCRNSTISYSFTDFTTVDHRLQLYLALEVLEENEELLLLIRVGVVPYLKCKEFPGLLIVSQSRVHILRITGEETDQPQDWLQKYSSHSLDMLFHLNIRLGNQAFQLEFGPKVSPCCFTFLLRDADHCNNFITALLDKLKDVLLERPDSNFHSGLDGEETLQTIREYLLPWKPNEFLENYENTEIDDQSIILYLMCYWMPQGKKSFEPISIAMTVQDIYIFSEDFHWPLPHLTLPPNEVLSCPQLIPLDRKKIQDLTSLEQIENHSLEMTLIFLDENSQDEIYVNVATETEESLKVFVQALKEPWEKLFNVDLQVNVKTEENCSLSQR